MRLTYHRDRDDVIEPLLYLSTIYNRHRTLPNLRQLISYRLPTNPHRLPGIPSPLCPENRSFYRYRTRTDEGRTMRPFFKSRIRNTQLLRRGWVTIEKGTGRN